MTLHLHQGARAAVDDAEWVLRMYREAKEIVTDLRDADDVTLPSDLRERVENFWTDTFMDECTTLSFDCACNRRGADTSGGKDCHA